MISRLLALGIAGVATVTAALACGSDGPTAPATLPLLSVERPDSGTLRAGATRELVLLTPANRTLRIVAEGRGGASTDSLLAIVGTPDGAGELGRLTFSAAPGAARVLVITSFPTETQLPVTIRGLRATDAGGYRVTALPPGDDPEHGPALLLPDSSVVEFHDGPSDIDRFLVSVAAGERFVLRLAKQGFTTIRQITVNIEEPTGFITSRAELRADHSEDAWTMPFAARGAGTAVISVTGPADSGGWYGGSYSLRVIRSSLAPEQAAATFALNDTIADAIDVVGDADEYRFTAPANTRVRILPRLDRTLDAPITFSLYRPDGPLVGRGTAAAATDWDNVYPIGDRVVGTQGLPPELLLPFAGEYRLVVEGPLDLPATAGTTPYAFIISTRGDAPESAPAVAAPGPLVSGETLAGCADADEFRIPVDSAMNLAVGVARSADGCALRVTLFRNGSVARTTIVANSSGDPDRQRFEAFPVVPGDELILRVEAERSIVGSGPSTPYVFDAYAVDSRPSVAPATLVLNGGPFTEPVNRCGDVDVYEFDVPSAQRLVVHASLERAVSCPGHITIERIHDWIDYIGDFALSATPNGDPDQTGLSVFLPQSGRYRMTWRSEATGASADRGALMSIDAITLSDAPETASATATLGDIISGETLSRCGDVDEYLVALPTADAAIALELGRNVACPVTAELRFAGQILTTFSTTQAQPLPTLRSPTFSNVGERTFRLVVRSQPNGSVADRDLPYRVAVVESRNQPETVGDTLTLGDSISTEGIESPGDIDDFYVALEPGRVYLVNFIGDVRLSIPDGGVSVDPAITPPLPSGIRTSGQFGVVSAGFTRLRFLGATSESTGPYSFQVFEVNFAPEVAPAELPFDQWVEEPLTPIGDRDRFFVRATSDEWVRVSAERVQSVGSFVVEAQFTELGPEGRSIPLSGFQDSVRIELRGQLTSNSGPGRYRVRVDRLGSDPESLPSAFAVGDTIRGEGITEADVDRFTTVLPESGRYQFYLRGTSGCFPQFPLGFRITTSIDGYSGGTFGTLVDSVEGVAGDTLTFIVLPSTPVCQTGSYEFAILRAP